MESKITYDVVPIETLRQHEQIIEERLVKVVEIIRREQCVDIPIIVDRRTLVVLDGHHRLNSLIRLGAKRAPVCKIDYFDDSLITVQARPESGFASLSKQDILDMGLSPTTFKPKTTRHTLKFDVKRINHPLKDLM